MTLPAPRRLFVRPIAPLLLAAAALLAGCGTTVVNPVTGKAERTVMDEQAELVEGRKAHAQVLAEYGVDPHPRLQAYVSELGSKLVQGSHRAQLTWTFTVLDSPEVNAFALPGGYVYVTRGILAYLDSEAELAGVIGHEIGHVTARHGAQRATRQQSAGVGVFAATLLGAVVEAAGVGGATELAARASQGLAAGLVASYSRDQELQADQLGAEYLARSQYNPRHMVEVIQVLRNQERFAADQARAAGRPAPSGGNWLASHPSNERRLADIQHIADGYADPATTAYKDEGRARYLAALDGVVFGDSPRQGVTRGGQFLHEDLGLAWTVPTGWQVQNQPQALLLLNPAGDAGLQLRLVPAEAAKAGNPEAVLRALIKPTDGRAETLSLGGLAATRFTGTRRNAQGQPQAVRATAVSAPSGALLLLLPVARDAAAAQRAAGALAAAEAGLRAMTPADRSAARAWTLATVRLPAGGLAELARRSPLQPPALALAQLKLINGVYGDGVAEPAPGSLVKTVR